VKAKAAATVTPAAARPADTQAPRDAAQSRWATVHDRRKASAELTALIGRPPNRWRPCSYGLTRNQVAAERARFAYAGWAADADTVLVRPSRVPVDGWCGQ
jgi:hypothetical protein